MKQHMQKERKKERKKEKKKKEQNAKQGGKKKKERSRGRQVEWQRNRKGQGTEASKLVLQLTTMPALALASYHDELLLETRPWKTSSAPRCSPGGSGLVPW
jgi:hypothetical protein